MINQPHLCVQDPALPGRPQVPCSTARKSVGCSLSRCSPSRPESESGSGSGTVVSWCNGPSERYVNFIIDSHGTLDQRILKIKDLQIHSYKRVPNSGKIMQHNRYGSKNRLNQRKSLSINVYAKVFFRCPQITVSSECYVTVQYGYGSVSYRYVYYAWYGSTNYLNTVISARYRYGSARSVRIGTDRYGTDRYAFGACTIPGTDPVTILTAS